MQCHAITWHAIFLLSGIFKLFNSTTVVLRVSCRQHDDGETDSQETEEADLGSCHCKNNFEHLNIWHITLALGWNDGLAIGAGACWAGSYHHAEYHEHHGGHLSGLFPKLDCCRPDFARHCMFLLGSYLVCCTWRSAARCRGRAVFWVMEGTMFEMFWCLLVRVIYWSLFLLSESTLAVSLQWHAVRRPTKQLPLSRLRTASAKIRNV